MKRVTRYRSGARVAQRAEAHDRSPSGLPRAARANGHRRGDDQPPRSPARRGRAPRAEGGEGRLPAEAVHDDARRGDHPPRRRRAPGRILQVGSQQRSWGPNEQFRKAVELVRSGRVGNLRRVEIGLPIDPTAPDSPEQPVPSNLNYDMWLGPTPEVYYTEQRVHSQRTLANGEPDIQSRPGWLRNESYCLGMITGWGAHHFDTAHWGMDMELTGPSRDRRARRVPDEQDLERARHVPRRAHVSRQRHDDGVGQAAERHQVHRRRRLDLRLARRVATASDPSGVTTSLKSLDASDPRLLDPTGLKVSSRTARRTTRTGSSACSRGSSRSRPRPSRIASNNACIVSWIAMKLSRPAHLGREGRAFRERRRGERDAHAPRARAVRRAPARPIQDRHQIDVLHDSPPSTTRHRALGALHHGRHERRVRPAGRAAGWARRLGALPADHARPRALPRGARPEVHVSRRGQRGARLLARRATTSRSTWRASRASTRGRDQPTRWVVKPYTGPDFLERMLADRAGNVVVISGNNARKTEYIVRSIDAGLNVLADKPMVRTPR